MSKPVRVNISLSPSDLATIDEARGEVSRSEYLVTAALARLRGELEVPDALRVIEAALRRCGAL